MNNREIENRLSRALRRETPDVLSRVLSAHEQEETIVELNQAQQTIKKKHRWPIWAASAAAALALTAGTVWGLTGAYGTDSLISIDVNPSIELATNRYEKVLRVTALNDDADRILDGMDLKGTDLHVAMNALIGSMVKNGYIDEIRNSVLVSVDSKNSTRAAALQDELAADIQQALESSAISAAVLKQSVEEDDALRSLAEQYGISSGKAALIQQLSQQDPTLNLDELAAMNINDLSLLALAKDPDIQGAVSGTVSDKAYIGLEKAREIALAKQPDGTIKEISFDFENGRAVYEGELLYNGREYEFDIDAVSGDILKWRDDGPMDPDDQPIPDDGAYIGLEKAKEIALQRLPGAQVLELKLDRDDGRVIYEGELATDTLEADFEIDALTGDILKWEEEARRGSATQATQAPTQATQAPSGNASTPTNPSAGYLGLAQVQEIVLAKVPGGTIRDLEFDYEDGRPVYEGEVRQGRLEVDFEIDALTGHILKWETDYDD